MSIKRDARYCSDTNQSKQPRPFRSLLVGGNNHDPCSFWPVEVGFARELSASWNGCCKARKHPGCGEQPTYPSTCTANTPTEGLPACLGLVFSHRDRDRNLSRHHHVHAKPANGTMPSTRQSLGTAQPGDTATKPSLKDIPSERNRREVESLCKKWEVSLANFLAFFGTEALTAKFLSALRDLRARVPWNTAKHSLDEAITSRLEKAGLGPLSSPPPWVADDVKAAIAQIDASRRTSNGTVGTRSSRSSAVMVCSSKRRATVVNYIPLSTGIMLTIGFFYAAAS